MKSWIAVKDVDLFHLHSHHSKKVSLRHTLVDYSRGTNAQLTGPRPIISQRSRTATTKHVQYSVYIFCIKTRASNVIASINRAITPNTETALSLPNSLHSLSDLTRQPANQPRKLTSCNTTVTTLNILTIKNQQCSLIKLF